MNAKEYYRSLSTEERKALAERAGTKLSYLVHVFYGHRKPSHELAKRLAKASGGVITKEELRPDIWDEETAA